MDNEGQITVKKLIGELQKYPDNTEVHVLWRKGDELQDITDIYGPDDEWPYVVLEFL